MASVGKVDEEMADKIARLTTKSIFKGDKERVPWMKSMIWWKIN